MRSAACAAGLVASADSPQLLLVSEPEAALMACIAEGALHEYAAPGKRLALVDCGGGAVDIAMVEIVSGPEPGPLALSELFPPTSGAWGAVAIDDQFFALIKDVLGGHFTSLGKVTLLEMLGEWDNAKRALTGADDDKDVTINVSSLIDELTSRLEGFTKSDVDELISHYNSKHGYRDDEKGGLVLVKGKKLRIPASIAHACIAAVAEKITARVAELLAIIGGRIDAIVLVGGSAASAALVNIFRARFGHHLPVVVPRLPSAAVARGAAMCALRPAVVKERVMQWSYGYLGAEPYDPSLHDGAHAFVTAQGRRLVHVLFPLVQAGARVDAAGRVDRRGLIPVREDQLVMDFELFLSAERIVDPRAEPRAPRTVVVNAHTVPRGRNAEVLRAERVGMLSINIGGAGRPRRERAVDLTVFFGAEEVRAFATSVYTQEVSAVATIAP